MLGSFISGRASGGHPKKGCIELDQHSPGIGGRFEVQENL